MLGPDLLPRHADPGAHLKQAAARSRNYYKCPHRVDGDGHRTTCSHWRPRVAVLACMQGFKLDEKMKLTLVKQVEYNGQRIEAAWPLGAAINDLSS